MEEKNIAKERFIQEATLLLNEQEDCFTFVTKDEKITLTIKGKETVEVHGFFIASKYLSENIKVSASRVDVNCINRLFVYSDLTAPEFADYLIENMGKVFDKPLRIPKIVIAIQQFRTYTFKANNSNAKQVLAKVDMKDTGYGILENIWQDYMYSNGEYIMATLRVGLEVDGVLELDKGIYIANTPRREWKQY